MIQAMLTPRPLLLFAWYSMGSLKSVWTQEVNPYLGYPYPLPFSFDSCFDWSKWEFCSFYWPYLPLHVSPIIISFSTACLTCIKQNDWLFLPLQVEETWREYSWWVMNTLKFHQNMKKEHFDDFESLLSKSYNRLGTFPICYWWLSVFES